MGSEAVECEQCGATMVPQRDGRTYACEYCSAQILVAVDGNQIARGLEADLANVEVFLQKLAQMLSETLSDRTKVQQHGAAVVHLEVDLSPDVFVAKREPHGVATMHKRMSRGIALKTTPHPLDHWFDLLTEALARHANQNQRAGQALSRLTGR